MSYLRLTIIVAISLGPTSVLLPAVHAQSPPNLVRNGDFEQGVDDHGQPTAWQTSGCADIKQSLTLDRGAAARTPPSSPARTLSAARPMRT